MTQPNYVLKGWLLNERQDLINAVKTINKSKYMHAYSINENDPRFLGACSDLESCLALEHDLKEQNAFLYHEAEKINSASLKRNQRLKKRIASYINSGNCLFLTLTFNDDVLERTNEETRRKYVRRFLKSYSNCYVANIDYGLENEREHYHAVMVYPFRIDSTEWPYGFSNIKKVKMGSESAISKYINKLTNHAIKNTSKRNALIYSQD